MLVRGHAEFVFEDSAGLSLARALERAFTDVDKAHPEAWVIEDRTISFSLEAELTQAEREAYRRLLDALLDEAVAGEASLDAGGDRWARRLRLSASGVPQTVGSGAAGAESAPDHPTIKTRVG